MAQSFPITPAVPPVPRVGASFTLRALAQIIDLVVHNVTLLVTAILFGVCLGIAALVVGVPTETFTQKLNGNPLLATLIGISGYVLYHTASEGLHGATLGKLIMKLFVVQEDGSRCSMGSAFLRSLAFQVDALFVGIVAYSSMRSSELQQRYGDKWAHTVVVERSQLPDFDWPSGWRFLIGFAAALFADGLLYAAFLLSLVLI